MLIKEQYVKAYNSYKSCIECCNTKYEWVASEIFGLSTYDGELDEIFVKKICEVCKCIADRKTFEYIEASQENYITYILVCQILGNKEWIDWGTSIRGAWFTYSAIDDILFWECYGENDQMFIEVPFSKENLLALIEFIEEEE